MADEHDQIQAAVLRFTAWSMKVNAQLDTISAETRALARGQRALARRQRRYSDRTVASIAALLTRRAALLFALGMLVGSALGSAGGELIKPVLLRLLGSH